MGVSSCLGKGRWMRGAWVWPALTLIALTIRPAMAADRVVIAEEFTANS